MHRYGSVAGRLGLLASVALAAASVSAQDPAAEFLGQAAPGFRLTEVRSGETRALEEFRGRFVVLHFGASW
jgi:hypothetical protein